MIMICPKDKCTGCYACVNACHHNSITMQEDEYGELHPIINDNTCINCGACEKACPNNNERFFNKPIICYASWITDKKKRSICASGGIATIMSEYIIKYCNGVVFGSRYDNDFEPIISYTEKAEELERFKGSRYVQSKIGENTYRQALAFLKEGKKVVFIGTPCQIAGLKSYLKKDYLNLITVDLICHGCSPTSYFREELKEIRETEKLKNISDVRFRGNDGYNYRYSIWSGNECIYDKKGCTSYYLAGFLLGITLRENCYNCEYARPERVSDITIGDFIGLGQKEPFAYPKGNVSSVFINTQTGKEFFDEVTNAMPDLKNVERQIEERLRYKPSLLEPAKRSSLNSRFRSEYIKNGYVVASRTVLADVIKQYNLKYKINSIQRILLLPYRVLKKSANLFYTNYL